MTRRAPNPSVVLDFLDDCGPQGGRACFTRPAEIVVARSACEVRPALRRIERAAAGGMYAAGYVAYEAAQAFDRAFVVRPDSRVPLLWFGIFDSPSEFNPAGDGEFRLSEWKPSICRSEYDRCVATARERIARGDTYQVNYTLRLRAVFEGDDFAFYERLRAAQRTRFGAYVNDGRFRILSASPELFFRRRGASIVTRPMKGTVRRGRWREEDARLAAWLAASEKNRAENLMIVDLLRNDLGRIAEFGTVHVPTLFEVERYPTLLQMVSTVAATLRPNTTLEEIFAALFPCGSVTGAPKVSTMRLIAALEDSPRGIYCGAVGFVAPGGDAVFNVAIRTVVIDAETGAAEYGVGGGVTWDSTAAGEYAETLDKAALLTEEARAFDLLETMLLENCVYGLLEDHLERLAESAAYFEIPLSIERVRAALADHARCFTVGRRRARLLVSTDGRVHVESEAITETPAVRLRVALARTPVSKTERFLYHKTTRRRLYDERRAEDPEAFDVLLWNEEGELTEFTNGNLVLELDGERWTPPRECGLLAGTFRAWLLRRGEIRERVLKLADIGRASRCWLVNSVRGWVEVTFTRRGRSGEFVAGD
ncbi:MAG: para-aminobenzoate synthetase / 4-amino-4-deoxychorismate lyase [Acidobacteriota bacterium]|jgi:para-aminobenzoate synthetase/4-amino-4-deoxychorismate lyase|nr:para-aminobenzoate synthetase / 4-amino-4-deoxychorismate lyase [Acidobacteriota bacterium]